MSGPSRLSMSLKALQECGQGPWGAAALESAFSCESFPCLRAHRARPPVSPICDPGPGPAPHGLPFAPDSGKQTSPRISQCGRRRRRPRAARLRPGPARLRAGKRGCWLMQAPEGGCGRRILCISFACPSFLSSPRTPQSTPALAFSQAPVAVET